MISKITKTDERETGVHDPNHSPCQLDCRRDLIGTELACGFSDHDYCGETVLAGYLSPIDLGLESRWSFLGTLDDTLKISLQPIL